AGAAFNVTITAFDSFGNVAVGYLGTVGFSSSDPAATLPGSYTYTANDNGAHTFSVVLQKAGNQTVTCRDKLRTALNASIPVTVTSAALDHFVVSVPSSTI